MNYNQAFGFGRRYTPYGHISQPLPFNLLVLPLSPVVQVRIPTYYTAKNIVTPNSTLFYLTRRMFSLILFRIYNKCFTDPDAPT